MISNFEQRVQKLFKAANFIQDLGIEMVLCEPGICKTELILAPKHLQQDGFVHAGVQATIADHTAGAAGCSIISDDQIVLSVEFKINLLRPAKGKQLFCEAEVLKPGKTLIIVESSVWTGENENKKMTAKSTVTLAVVAKSTLEKSSK